MNGVLKGATDAAPVSITSPQRAKQFVCAWGN